MVKDLYIAEFFENLQNMLFMKLIKILECFEIIMLFTFKHKKANNDKIDYFVKFGPKCRLFSL